MVETHGRHGRYRCVITKFSHAVRNERIWRISGIASRIFILGTGYRRVFNIISGVCAPVVVE
jgi:hypothetical protein